MTHVTHERHGVNFNLRLRFYLFHSFSFVYVCIFTLFVASFLSCFSNNFFSAHTNTHTHAARTRFQSTGSTPNNYRSISSLLSQDANVRRNLHEGILNKDQEDEMFVYGYKKSKFRTFLCYTFVVLTLGILRLVMHWWSHWLLLATHKSCSLEDAEKVLVEEKFQGKHSIYYVKTVTSLTSDTIR